MKEESRIKDIKIKEESEKKLKEESKKESKKKLKKDKVVPVDKLVKSNMKLKQALAIILFLSIMSVGFLIYAKQSLVIERSTAVGIASFSILFNIIIIAILFASGMGQDIVGRLKRRIMFGTGRYVNTLYISKNGPIKELFKPVDSETGTFKIMGRTCTRNPSLMHSFKKIPTYVHREGNPDPVNIFENHLAGVISEAEIDLAMMSKGAFDFKQWLKQNALFVVIGALVVIGAAAFAGYTGMMNMQMLRDGTYAAVQCVVPVVEIVAGGVV